MYNISMHQVFGIFGIETVYSNTARTNFVKLSAQKYQRSKNALILELHFQFIAVYSFLFKKNICFSKKLANIFFYKTEHKSHAQ